MEYKKILLPDNLSEETTRYVKKVIDNLKKDNKLNVIDEGTLYILADSHNQFIKASEILSRDGLTIPGSRNTIVVHPCVKVAKDNKACCLEIMKEMGLTLKSRQKMNVAGSEEEDSPLLEFIKGNK